MGQLELVFVVVVFGFGFLGYVLLQQDNHWFKVVGGTLTVLLVLSIPTIVFFGVILNMISSSGYY